MYGVPPSQTFLFLMQMMVNIGIKHLFSTSPSGPGKCYCIGKQCLIAIKNEIFKYLNEIGKIWGKYGTIFLSHFGSPRVSEQFFNVRLPGPRTSRDSKWLPSFDLKVSEMTRQDGYCTTVVLKK